jgi:hypothetical protein
MCCSPLTRCHSCVIELVVEGKSEFLNTLFSTSIFALLLLPDLQHSIVSTLKHMFSLRADFSTQRCQGLVQFLPQGARVQGHTEILQPTFAILDLSCLCDFVPRMASPRLGNHHLCRSAHEAPGSFLFEFESVVRHGGLGSTFSIQQWSWGQFGWMIWTR